MKALLEVMISEQTERTFKQVNLHGFNRFFHFLLSWCFKAAKTNFYFSENRKINRFPSLLPLPFENNVIADSVGDLCLVRQRIASHFSNASKYICENYWKASRKNSHQRAITYSLET